MAYALDVAGERWSLLIVRDLGLGPRRYRDLQRGLPGLSSNLLAERLRSLTRDGVIAKQTLPPPAGVVVYTLTDSGFALLAALEPLVRWGLQHLPPTIPSADDGVDHVGAVPAMTALTLLHAAAPSAEAIVAVVRLQPDVFTLRSAVSDLAGGRGLQVQQGVDAQADIDLSSDPATFMQVMTGQRAVSDATASGALRLHRGADAFDTLLVRFRSPATLG